MPTATTSISMELKSMAEAAAVTAAFVALATRSGAMGRATVPPDNTAPEPASLQHTQGSGMLTPASKVIKQNIHAQLHMELRRGQYLMLAATASQRITLNIAGICGLGVGKKWHATHPDIYMPDEQQLWEPHTVTHGTACQTDAAGAEPYFGVFSKSSVAQLQQRQRKQVTLPGCAMRPARLACQWLSVICTLNLLYPICWMGYKLCT